MTPHLELVPDKPVELADIYAGWRAEIRARDWRLVHERGNRAAPLDMADRRRWGWM